MQSLWNTNQALIIAGEQNWTVLKYGFKNLQEELVGTLVENRRQFLTQQVAQKLMLYM